MRSEALYAELAAAILDGAPIDWAAAEASGSDADRPVLARLKALAAIAELHRSQQPPLAERRVAIEPEVAIGRWGHLRLLERLGGGSFGEVYRAWDERLDREVALKLLDEAAEPGTSSGAGGSTLLEEGRVLARVRHPNVVTLYDADVIDGRIGLWMELVPGRTLEQRVAEGKRFDAAEAASLGVDLCHAVGAVHAAGLLHRDIKASNVMLADDGRVVLMDFGAGRELDAAGSSLAGTPLYLAPELFAGAAPSAASDVYSLAVLLHRLLEGAYPVAATNVPDLRHAHERGERTRLERERPDLPARFARAIDRALDPDPARRPTLDQLAADLAPYARSSRRSRLLRRLVVAAAVLLVLGTGWEILGRRSGKPTPSSALFAGLGLVREPAASDARITEPTLVVLPFDNLGEGTEGDSFADGLADEIIRDLARVDGLAVRSRYSSFTFREEPRDLDAIGRRLGAKLAVTGSVLRSGDRIRVNAQLVDLGHDRPLWAGRFDRELDSAGDLFAIVDEIARNVVNELRLTLGAGIRRYDTDLEVYDRFLEARALAERRGLDGPRDAIVILDQILAADQAFAPAHALRAEAYGYMSMLPYQSPVKPAEALVRMRQAATRALELDPMLAEAHAAMGVVRAWERSWSKSEESFERALDLDATLTAISTGFSFWTLRPQLEYDRAQRVLESALESDPLSIDVQREILEVAFCRGHYGDAIAGAERLRVLDPDLPFVNQFLGRALIFDGRPAEGLALLELEETRGRGNPHYRAHGLVRLGRRAEVEQLAIEHRGFPNREAGIHAALGNADRAFEALERMMIGEPHRVPILLTYPEMATLREDPRMVALRERLGLNQRSAVEPPSPPP